MHSPICLLLAFLTIFSVCAMTIGICIRVFDGHKLSIIQYELPPKEYNPKISFSTDDFKFGLSLLDFEHPEDVFVSYDWNYWNYEVGTIPMNMNAECKFGLVPTQNFKCFDQDETTKGKTYLDAKGSWVFSIKYRSCFHNNPFGIGCANENDIPIILKNNAKATLVYEDLVIDPDNYENPITTIENDVSAMVWTDVGTTLIVELSEVEFISDNGWIFEDLKTVKKLKATTVVKITGQKMLDIQLVYGGKKTVYKRTYPKIQDFLAQISGYILMITPIFVIIVSSYGNRQVIQNIINEIYEIKLKKPDDRKRRSCQSNTGTGTEQNLSSQNQARPPESNEKGVSFAEHTALVIGCFNNNLEKPSTKEEIPQIPDEHVHVEHFRFDSLEKSPSSSLKSTLISPRNEECKLLTSIITSIGNTALKPENERLNENLEAKEVQNQSLAREESKGEEEKEEEVPLRTSDPLKVTWKDWVKSFWKSSPEVQVMKKAKEHIMETFDLAKLSKKVSDIDKLKACLLTNEQRVIFEHLPSSVIALNLDIDIDKPEAIKQYHWNNSCKGDKEALRKAYAKLKEEKNELNKSLIKYYENDYICDGLSA